MCYCIFHLLIDSEFRISQICNLTIDSIKQSQKPNEYYLYSYSKVSHGEIVKYCITTCHYRNLIEIINETDKIRNKYSIKSNKDYIFIYEGEYDSISVVTPQLFTTYMKRYANELGWDYYYTASNLRDTHMTKSSEFIRQNKKSNLDLSVLTSHSDEETTKRHYIELQLEAMLESTYGIIIGDLDDLIENKKNIKDEIPKEIDKYDNIVEDGCGSCTAKLCTITTSLPCLICENFITTPKHEVFFLKAIEKVNRLIEQASTKHDKDDLTTIKALYVLYLKEIYKFEEENNNV